MTTTIVGETCLCDALRNEFEVIEASTYQEAVDKFVGSDRSICLLVADLNLKGNVKDNEEGMILIRKLKELDPCINVLIVTGYPSISTNKDTFKTLDVFDYLEKVPQDQEFDIPTYVERVREAVAESTKRRAESAPGRLANVLVFIKSEELRKKVQRILAHCASILTEDCSPGATNEEKKRQLTKRPYDVVITSVDPSDSLDKVSALLDSIWEHNPSTQILGVGHYDPSHKLVANALTSFGLANLVDLAEPLEITQSVLALRCSKVYHSAFIRPALWS